MNAFGVLGVAEKLEISEEDLRQAFRERGAELHPDAGGSEEAFAELKEALGILSSPSKRLRHWLERRGVEMNLRGTIGKELMDLFGTIGELTREAEGVIRKREEAKSGLAKALLEPAIQRCREGVEELMPVVEAALVSEMSGFSRMESSVDEAMAAVRNLAFLEKWKAGLKMLYSRLV